MTVVTRDMEVRDETRPAMAAKCDDYSRIDDLKLAHEVWPKSTFFLWLGIAVVGRAVFDYVRDIDVATVHASRFKHLVEKLARGTDKRYALLVFFLPRRFTDKDDIGIGIAIAHHELLRRLAQVRADIGGEYLIA